jgi:pimeloyl-ACP methyl ester carboxylesterase
MPDTRDALAVGDENRRRPLEPRVVEHHSQGQGSPLVLLPGGLTGWNSWIPHQERLASSFRVIRLQPIPNELGSAGHPGDPSYTVDTERESLRLTLDALGIEAADFAGWSAGGNALLEFTMAYPERVRTLTLVEPGAFWVLDKLGVNLAMAIEVNAQLYQLAGQTVTEDDLERFLVGAGLAAPGEDVRQHPYWDLALPHRMALSWFFEHREQSDRSIQELRQIACPTLLIKGSDSTAELRQIVDVLGDTLPNARVVELDGDHGCHIQSIDRFLDELTKHLSVVHA